MGYFKIAESTRYNITVELWELSDTDPGLAEELLVLDFIERQGITSLDKYAPHLPYEVQIPILDVNRFFLGRIRNYGLNQFKLKATDPAGATIGEWYVNTRFSEQNFSRATDVLPLVGFDGITLLKGEDPVTTLQPVGELFETLLHLTGITFDVIVTSDLTHYLSAGQNGLLPNQYRTDPLNFVRGVETPTAYDQLMNMLAFFKCQVFQEAGVWRVMEREARAGTAMNVFNITADTAGTTDPTLTLSDSDLRAEPGEDFYDPIRMFRRVADTGFNSYEFDNGELNKWGPDDEELLFWEVNSATTITRIEELNDIGFQVVADSVQVSQHPPYSVDFKDVVRFRFKCSFEWHASQAPGSTRRVDLARIRLLKNDGGIDRGLLISGSSGTFDSGADGIIFDEIDTDSFTAAKSFDYDFEVEIPTMGTLLIELYFTGDTADVSVKPKFFVASIEGVTIHDKPTKEVFTFSHNKVGRSLTDTVRLTDPHKFIEPADFEFFDGATWEDIVFGWEDPPDGPPIPVNQVIAAKIIASGASFDHVLNLPIDYNTDVKLFNSILYTLEGEQRTYLPLFIERKRKAKQARIKMIQIKSEAAADPEVSYE